jgi:hypothetical protein
MCEFRDRETDERSMMPVAMRGPGPGGYHAANGLDQEDLQALRDFKGIFLQKILIIIHTLNIRIRAVLGRLSAGSGIFTIRSQSGLDYFQRSAP